MLATNLGLRLGLPMPRVEVIDVSDRLVENTGDLRVEVAGASVPCSSGRQLASLYAGDMIEASICEYLPDAALGDVVNLQDFARVLVLDKWTCKRDGRQVIFKHETSRSPKYTAVFIDQGFCFNAGHHAEGIFLSERIFGVTITNSEGKQVPVRYIGEQHVKEDLGRIPTAQDWLSLIKPQRWMYGQRLSYRKKPVAKRCKVRDNQNVRNS